METFGHRLRMTRMRFGWTQKELAHVCGLTQSAIGNYESGQRTEPTSAALIKLAKALDVSPEWLSQGGPPPAMASTPPATSRSNASDRAGRAGTWPFAAIAFQDYMAL